ncbi:MAG: polyprenyl synthetase family protein [Candidatus Omnitrophica bacterium]|nr:polyprenyl synthetase family protein [Candidatus Omnitrophota bacterium]MDD5042583.1 polyprenyl synthetase family protein [Candidatus Omnitrophota bacterium]MDD5501085.1 polyprenyl synthetase family protein [Candidatus Omnitrophota bacterium]
MFMKMKIRIEKELHAYIKDAEKTYSLKRLSPPLFESIKEFICRPGKRVRPILFCIGYLGFSKKTTPGLYRSALSLELLHDFMLVHDDIIDKSDTRRGLPSMHASLNETLSGNTKIRFDGEDLAIVIGDVMYAMGLDAFLSIKEEPRRKEAALKKLISAALYTGSGEFIELILGKKPIEEVSLDDIYKVYDYKTANYTFASPLSMGSILAGAKETCTKNLFSYGMLLGRAFQIKDDIIGIFGKEKDTGKSSLTDIKEAKRTILIWHAFNHSYKKDKEAIKKAMYGLSSDPGEFARIRRIIAESGSLSYAKEQISRLFTQAQEHLRASRMEKKYVNMLEDFSRKTLKA